MNQRGKNQFFQSEFEHQRVCRELSRCVRTNEVSVSEPAAMASPIKLFHTFQKFYKTMGLDTDGVSNQSRRSKNLLGSIKSTKLWKNLFFIISTLQLSISSTTLFLIDAQTADQYGLTFYVSITTFCALVNYLAITFKLNEISMLITKYEQFISKSWFKNWLYIYWMISKH